MAKITLVYDKISKDLERIERELNELPKEAFDVFREATPVDKGYAKNHTTLKRDTIVADYPYAVRLNDGYSKQAPKGMVEPTVKFLNKRVKQIFRK